MENFLESEKKRELIKKYFPNHKFIVFPDENEDKDENISVSDQEKIDTKKGEKRKLSEKISSKTKEIVPLWQNQFLANPKKFLLLQLKKTLMNPWN